MAADRAQNLQDTFLNHVRKTKTPLTIFLVNGVKLQGIVTWFDNFCLLLRRDGHSQLVYKHAISTVMPSNPLDLAPVAAAFAEDNTKPKQLQDIFLTAVRRQNNPVTMFLVNGVMLQGDIAAYDLFCMLLQRDGMVQLVYKHAVSTVQPAHPLNLAEDGADDDHA